MPENFEVTHSSGVHLPRYPRLVTLLPLISPSSPSNLLLLMFYREKILWLVIGIPCHEVIDFRSHLWSQWHKLLFYRPLVLHEECEGGWNDEYADDRAGEDGAESVWVAAGSALSDATDARLHFYARRRKHFWQTKEPFATEHGLQEAMLYHDER